MLIGVTPFYNRNRNMLLMKIKNSKVIFPDKTKYKIEYSDEIVDLIVNVSKLSSNILTYIIIMKYSFCKKKRLDVLDTRATVKKYSLILSSHHSICRLFLLKQC